LILENGATVPISVPLEKREGHVMTDPEVARLRRLRDEALRVREIARAFASAPWANGETTLSTGACVSWRIARVVSGKLKGQPSRRYQRGAGAGSLLVNRAVAAYLARARRGRRRALKEFESRVQALTRRLDDARALTRSTDFSDTLGRSQAELKALTRSLLQQGAEAVPVPERAVRRAPRHDGRTPELAPHMAGDSPYLAL
jgi:hypothetical protein